MNPLVAPATIESRAFWQSGAMRGFHTEFKSLDHYIRVITDRIWEGRRIDDIRLYYSDPCIVETALSVSTSVDDVISGTRNTLAMFPDRRLLAEDVIQSGNAEGGYLSSHRIISPMTHAGDGSFGKATGRKVHARTIADCVCKDNRIVHEWLVRDHAAIAFQIGTTPQTLAESWLKQRGGWHKPSAGAPPAGYVSHIDSNDQAQKFALIVQRLVMGETQVELTYDDAAQSIGPGEQTAYGHAEIAGFWHSVFGGFAMTSYDLEHLAWQSDAAQSGRPDRVAMRFRAKGNYLQEEEAPSPREYSDFRYGKRSAYEIELLGIVHAEFRDGRVIRQWVLLDEVAIWMQILNATGPSSA